MALLPFVDEKRLRKALEDVYPDLTAGESEYICIYIRRFPGGPSVQGSFTIVNVFQFV